MDQIIKLLIYLSIVIIFQYLYVYLHEGGHYIAARLSGFKNVKIGYEKYKFPSHVEIDDEEIAITPKADIKILFITICGPVFGLIPFIAVYLFVRPIQDLLIDISVVILTMSYLWGCRKDFKVIMERMGNEGD